MRSTESFALANNVTGAFTGAVNPTPANPNAPATVNGVAVTGGRYTVLAHGTLGTGPAVQVQDPFGNWYTVTSSLAADAPQIVEVPAGQVRANLGSDASGAYVSLSRIPED